MKTRILFITQHFPPEISGNASRIFDLSRNLIKLGCEVTVISPYPTFPHGSYKKTRKLYSYREIDQIKHINIFSWQPPYDDPSFLSRVGYYITFPLHAILWALIKRREYDVILTTAPPVFCGLPGLIIKKIVRKRWYLDIRDLWIDASVELGFLKEKSFFERLSRIYEHICYRSCDRITVTTEKIKKNIIDIYKISPNKIILVPNGVDTNLFKPRMVTKNRLVYAGNIGHAQDLDKIILAVKKINNVFPLEFYLIGDGDIKNNLEELVLKENLSTIVTFSGLLEREKIPILISESLIGVAPLKNIKSLNYAIPTKIYEYMACGIPFIVTGKGEIEDFVNKTQAGVIADNDIDSIYKAILRILKDKKLINEMGEKGRDFVIKYFDRKKIAELLLTDITSRDSE